MASLFRSFVSRIGQRSSSRGDSSKPGTKPEASGVSPSSVPASSAASPAVPGTSAVTQPEPQTTSISTKEQTELAATTPTAAPMSSSNVPVVPALASKVDAEPQSVQVYTHNITRRPIAWDPARQRPTQELVHAIHSALHFALDPCVSHPDEKASFCVVSNANASSASNDTSASGSGKRTLIVPCVNDIAKSPRRWSDTERQELTIKLFAGFDGAPLTREHVQEALAAFGRVYPATPPAAAFASKVPPPGSQLLATPLGPRPAENIHAVPPGGSVAIVGNEIHLLDANGTVIHVAQKDPKPIENRASSKSIPLTRPIDRFVVSLEGVHWAGDAATENATVVEDASLKHIDALRDAWTYLSAQSHIGQLGVADFSEPHLARLEQVLSNKSDAEEMPSRLPCAAAGASSLKLPKIGQLNFEDDLPQNLTEFAEKRGIALVAHSDELGTQRQFVNLLLEFKDTLPLPAPLKARNIEPDAPEASVSDVFQLKWALKYTLLLPDRGLVADNGYIISADFP